LNVLILALVPEGTSPAQVLDGLRY
jgi:hypothetical protein